MDVVLDCRDGMSSSGCWRPWPSRRHSRSSSAGRSRTGVLPSAIATAAVHPRRRRRATSAAALRLPGSAGSAAARHGHWRSAGSAAAEWAAGAAGRAEVSGMVRPRTPGPAWSGSRPAVSLAPAAWCPRASMTPTRTPTCPTATSPGRRTTPGRWGRRRRLRARMPARTFGRRRLRARMPPHFSLPTPLPRAGALLPLREETLRSRMAGPRPQSTRRSRPASWRSGGRLSGRWASANPIRQPGE